MKIARSLTWIALALAVTLPAVAQDSTSDASSVPSMQEAGAMLQQGDSAAAAEMFEAIHNANPKNGQAWFMHGYAVHMQGDHEKALKLHMKAATFPNMRPAALYNAGCAHAMLGQKDEAFECLRLAADAGQAPVAQFTGDTDLASLHSDERWPELIERLEAAKENSPASAMHFWVGEWDCYSPNGSLSGTNHLQLVNNNMFIHEQWINSQGQVGQSFNYYDIEEGKWRQIWVDPTRQLEMTAEPGTPGKLLFEGRNYDQAGNVSYRQMLVLSLDGGRVYQEGRQSQDGQEWSVAYRLIYMPKGEAFNGEGLPTPGA